ncbi:unnamed protein product, partial [Rotaria sp. Silwood1]
PTETVSASNASNATLKKLPPLRGGDSCREHCYTIICVVVFMSIGFIIFAAGTGAYTNDNNNTAARNAAIVGGVILAFGILCCIGAICKACADGTDHCCGCHFICCE